MLANVELFQLVRSKARRVDNIRKCSEEQKQNEDSPVGTTSTGSTCARTAHARGVRRYFTNSYRMRNRTRRRFFNTVL
jgi:hypothetical protein